MQARIERVAGAPIFAVARTDNLPPSFFASLKGSPQLERLIRSIRSLTLAGKPTANSITLALDGDCDSMSSAFQIAALLESFRFLGTAVLADPQTRRQMTKEQAAFLDALLRQVKVNHQDHWVRITLDVTPAMLGGTPSASSNLPPQFLPDKRRTCAGAVKSKRLKRGINRQLCCWTKCLGGSARG